MAPDKLCDVPAQVHLTHLVVHPHVSALQDCPKALDAIGVHAAAHVLLDALPDREMMPRRLRVSRMLVSVDDGLFICVLNDEPDQAFGVSVGNDPGDHLAG